MSRNTFSAAGRLIGSALILAAMNGIAPPAFAAAYGQYGGNWSVNMAQSQFGRDSTKLVLNRNNSMAALAKSGRRIVIYHGNIYLAAPGAAPTGNGEMRSNDLEQIGAYVQVIGDCGFACRISRPNDRLVLSFTNVNRGPHDMNEVAVVGGR